MGEPQRKLEAPADPLAHAWMTTAEAAEYCRMSVRALQQHIARGALKPDSPARPGFRAHRFRRATLDRFLEGEP